MLIQRDILDWRKRNPDCYLNDKKEKRSEGLASFVEKIILDSNESIKSNQGSLFNNLSKKQRSALERFEANQNIVIMPPDKDSSFIILNKNDYKKVCLKTLCNRYFYEELKEGPSASYKDRFTNVIQKLLHDSLITNSKFDILLEGNETPTFYVLAKTYKIFERLLPFQPICNSKNSVYA